MAVYTVIRITREEIDSESCRSTYETLGVFTSEERAYDVAHSDFDYEREHTWWHVYTSMFYRDERYIHFYKMIEGTEDLYLTKSMEWIIIKQQLNEQNTVLITMR